MIRLLSVRVFVAIVLCALAVARTSAQGGALEDFCLSKGGVWNAADGACQATTIIEMRVDYPVELASQYEFIESQVDQFVREQREDILALGTEAGFPVGDAVNYFLQIDSESFQHSDSVVSLLLTISTYTGGAHPNAFFEAMTFRIDEGWRLGFDDVFPPENNPLLTIVPLVQQRLMDQLGPDIDQTWLRRGTSMNSANYQDFVLTEDSVIFYFEPYQIAAYALGPQQVEIPLSELSGILAPLD